MALSNTAKRKFLEIGNADVLIGIPSYNNKDTIGFVIKEAVKGIKKFNNRLKAVIFNSDGGSQDGTPLEVEKIGKEIDFPVVSYPYEGPPGKGSSLFAIIEAGVILDVDAVIFLDSDLRSIRDWWVELFLDTILNKKYDYLTPYYIRHKYDGTITNNIVYPLIKGIFGFDIRQPIGGDFGLSGRIVSYYAGRIINVPTGNVFKFGIDIYLTTEAIAGGFNIGQVLLGAKIHDVKDPGKTLAPMFTQVTGTLFTQIHRYEKIWKKKKEIKEIKIEGKPLNIEPEEIEVNTDILFEKFKNGLKEYKHIYKKIINKESCELLFTLKEKDKFKISQVSWAHIVYDYLYTFKKEGESIIESLLPLYFGKILSFVNQTKDMTTREAEQLILEQANTFYRERDYFLKKY